MARTIRNLDDLATSAPMRPRTGRRFRVAFVEGHRDSTRRTRQLNEAHAAKVA